MSSVTIPEGWKQVDIREAKAGDWILLNGSPAETMFEISCPTIILEPDEVGDFVREKCGGPTAHKVVKVEDGKVYVDSNTWFYRTEVETVTFRPFKNAEEFKPYRDRWYKPTKGVTNRVEAYDDKGFWCDGWTSWESAFESSYAFEDGQPFGVPE